MYKPEIDTPGPRMLEQEPRELEVLQAWGNIRPELHGTVLRMLRSLAKAKFLKSVDGELVKVYQRYAASMSFCTRLREIMAARSVSQVALSKKLGIKSQIVGQWVNGKTKPVGSRLEDIARALDVSVADLMASSRHANPAPHSMRSLFLSENNFNTKAERRLDELIEALELKQIRAAAHIGVKKNDLGKVARGES